MIIHRVWVGFRCLYHICRDLLGRLWIFASAKSKALGWRNVGGETPEAEITSSTCDPRTPEPRREAEGGRREAAEGWALPEDADDLDGEQYRVDPADEFYCNDDSTWETEDQEQSPSAGDRRRPWSSNKLYKFRRFERAAKDMQNYRHNYPFSAPTHDDKVNLQFYLGLRPSAPDGMYIQHFHNNWKDDYRALESVHTYIQWLFPLQEQGMNSCASTLTKAEIKDFLKSDTAQANLLKSYKLMLNFYGITLCDENTGEVQRAPNWLERFHNLDRHTHNSLRITRILKCLGTLGFAHYQYPLVHFFLKETLENNQLPCIKESVLNYFVFAVLDKMQRKRLIKFAYLKYEPKDEFVWCPKKIQLIWSRWSGTEGI